MRRSRGGALEQNERNGSRAPSSQPILMTYILKDRKCFNYWLRIYVYHDLSEVIRGQTWVRTVKKGSIRAGWSEYIKYTYVTTQNFVGDCN